MDKRIETLGGPSNATVRFVSQESVVLAPVLRLGPHHVVFEIQNPSLPLRVSEVLKDFRLLVNELTAGTGTGRTVLMSLIDTGATLVCEATLDEPGLDLAALLATGREGDLDNGFAAFLAQFGRLYQVRPEFKAVIADLQLFFAELKIWMDRLELLGSAHPSKEWPLDLLRKLEGHVVPAALRLLERFEAAGNRVEQDLRPVHQVFTRRQLHPQVLCSPFLFRTFQKPLGYAGDYEMVNMMLREPFEGANVYARMCNRIFLETPPVVAHRQRITYLVDWLRQETARVASRGGRLRTLNLGCGPAFEVQQFMAGDEWSNRTDFALLDFNLETVRHTSETLATLRARHHRQTGIEVMARSVQHLLRDAARARAIEPDCDLAYCAGLFDYLGDGVCTRVCQLLYDRLNPGGLAIVTNVDKSNPSQNWMDFVLDWHLIYRTGAELLKLVPPAIAPYARAVGIGSGVNVAVEIRKPEHG